MAELNDRTQSHLTRCGAELLYVLILKKVSAILQGKSICFLVIFLCFHRRSASFLRK